jgi:hypothetical protein
MTTPLNKQVLTDEEIDTAYRDVWSTVKHGNRLSVFARTIEAALLAKQAEAVPVALAFPESRDFSETKCPRCDTRFFVEREVAAPAPTVQAVWQSYERMFNAACIDLGLINEALGLDPNDGGAESILSAIADLKTKQDGPLKIKVSFAPDCWDTFIHEVHGRITTNGLVEIQNQLVENSADIFTSGYGDYTFLTSYYTGQYGFEGRCEIAPGWELEQVEFVAATPPPTASEGV